MKNFLTIITLLTLITISHSKATAPRNLQSHYSFLNGVESFTRFGNHSHVLKSSSRNGQVLVTGFYYLNSSHYSTQLFKENQCQHLIPINDEQQDKTYCIGSNNTFYKIDLTTQIPSIADSYYCPPEQDYSCSDHEILTRNQYFYDQNNLVKVCANGLIVSYSLKDKKCLKQTQTELFPIEISKSTLYFLGQNPSSSSDKESVIYSLKFGETKFTKVQEVKWSFPLSNFESRVLGDGNIFCSNFYNTLHFINIQTGDTKKFEGKAQIQQFQVTGKLHFVTYETIGEQQSGIYSYSIDGKSLDITYLKQSTLSQFGLAEFGKLPHYSDFENPHHILFQNTNLQALIDGQSLEVLDMTPEFDGIRSNFYKYQPKKFIQIHQGGYALFNESKNGGKLVYSTYHADQRFQSSYSIPDDNNLYAFSWIRQAAEYICNLYIYSLSDLKTHLISIDNCPGNISTHTEQTKILSVTKVGTLSYDAIVYIDPHVYIIKNNTIKVRVARTFDIGVQAYTFTQLQKQVLILDDYVAKSIFYVDVITGNILKSPSLNVRLSKISDDSAVAVFPHLGIGNQKVAIWNATSLKYTNIASISVNGTIDQAMKCGDNGYGILTSFNNVYYYDTLGSKLIEYENVSSLGSDVLEPYDNEDTFIYKTWNDGFGVAWQLGVLKDKSDAEIFLE